MQKGKAVFQSFSSHWNTLKQMDCVTDDSIIALIKNVHAFNSTPPSPLSPSPPPAHTFCEELRNEMVLSLSADR